ncbi:uncharacterized protein LOC127079130 [Lathyrus oleraceus]|uniref:uncharacterized protein LOC127079130 n=1 Tax=Pisum sativum TaxID=3888 RepID=UPI0021D0931A|nr:uncharacterized protein LOC127079130 [Pisum sativum]
MVEGEAKSIKDVLKLKTPLLEVKEHLLKADGFPSCGKGSLDCATESGGCMKLQQGIQALLDNGILQVEDLSARESIEGVDEEVFEDAVEEFTSVDPVDSVIHNDVFNFSDVVADIPNNVFNSDLFVELDSDVSDVYVSMNKISDEVIDEEPRDYNEAMRSQNNTKWMKAMDDEMKSLHHNHTPELSSNLLHLDDILRARNNIEDVMKVKVELNKKFDMKDLGVATMILEIDIRRDGKHSILCLSQETYLKKIPEKFVCTRLDIACRVSLINRYKANPGKAHWQALKWILRCIKGYMSRVLVYGGATSDVEAEVKILVNSNHAGCIDTIKSLYGYVFIMFDTSINCKASL